MEMQKSKSPFQTTADKWPSDVVSRDAIDQFTGGLYARQYLANQDSQGLGPKGAIRVGNKVCYPKQCVVEWLEEKMKNSGKNLIHGKRPKKVVEQFTDEPVRVVK